MLSRLTVLAAVALLLVWLFAEALLGGMFAFRDAAHFYYPLFELVRSEWAAGRVPLWNPYENLGQPLAADATSSVFYPGKLIFALPIGYGLAYKLYIVLHLPLAAWGAYRLARHWQASVAAAGVCAISYAFSGNVMFTYCNVVFLVGAAWLPWAMLAADRMLVERSWRAAGMFGLVLALMVLGGDPQMVYHAGLLAALYAFVLWRHESPLSLWERVRVRGKWASGGAGSIGAGLPTARAPATANSSADSPHPGPLPEGEGGLALCRPVLLALAAATGMALSAVQVLPSLELARHSTRTAGPLADRLLGRVEPDTHAEHTYHFSVGPWRLAEYLWPNVAGRQFPIHRRWLSELPAEGRVWTPSLYMGVLPFLLALGAMGIRRRSEPATRWLSWSVVLAVLASFGWFGLGWLCHEVHSAFRLQGDGLPVGGPFGGLYWLLTLVLPGYAQFRYPAKWLVVAALGLSLLAARGWDRAFSGDATRLRRALLGLGGLSLSGAAAAIAIRPFWSGWFSAATPDVLFGPLDAAGAWADLTWAFVQTAVLCGLFWCLLPGRGQGRLSQPCGSGTDSPASANDTPVPFFRWQPVLAIVLTAVDLGVANRWMVAYAPATEWQRQPAAAAALDAAEGTRVWRGQPWFPPAWQADGSPTRLAEVVRWQRETLSPRYNLSCRIPLLDMEGTMSLYDYELWSATTCGGAAGGLLTAEYAILPGDKSLSGWERLPIDVTDTSLWHKRDPLPRAWIVHEVEWLPALAAGDPAAVRRRTEEVMNPGGRPRDLRSSAVVEVPEDAAGWLGQSEAMPQHDAAGASSTSLRPVPAATSHPITSHLIASHPSAGPPKAGPESCRILHSDPLRVELAAKLGRPGLVVLCDQFYPGWALEVETDGQPPRPVPVLRTDRIMRGAWLPAGTHRLVYCYRPASFVWGAALSGLGWTALLIGVTICVIMRGGPRLSA